METTLTWTWADFEAQLIGVCFVNDPQRVVTRSSLTRASRRGPGQVGLRVGRRLSQHVRKLMPKVGAVRLTRHEALRS